MVDDLSNDDELESDASQPGQRLHRIIKRESPPKQLRPLALVFEQGVPQPSYDVTVARWSDTAHAHLRSLSEMLRNQSPRVDLPVVGLRGRLELADSANLRLERSVGQYDRTATILWTETEVRACQEATNKA